MWSLIMFPQSISASSSENQFVKTYVIIDASKFISFAWSQMNVVAVAIETHFHDGFKGVCLTMKNWLSRHKLPGWWDEGRFHINAEGRLEMLHLGIDRRQKGKSVGPNFNRRGAKIINFLWL